jgi:AmmeMemoRadiSam system protein A
MTLEAPLLDGSARQELLTLARFTLETYLSTRQTPDYATGRPELQSRAGAFVTLRRGDELRGCIGHVAPDTPLYHTIQKCAISAAVEDTRFVPVTYPELPQLRIEISVLSPPERVHDLSAIVVGQHGLLVSRPHRRGLLLPQVAAENGWDRDTFLAYTCRKAGLPLDAWRDPLTIIETFTAQVFSEEKARTQADC